MVTDLVAPNWQMVVHLSVARTKNERVTPALTAKLPRHDANLFSWGGDRCCPPVKILVSSW